MNFNDCLKCSHIIYKKNKDKSIISIIISIISSFVCLFFLFLAFSFYHNINEMETKKLEGSRIQLTSNGSYSEIKRYIDLGNKYNAKAIVKRNIYITLFDFDKDYKNEFALIGGSAPKNDEIIVSSNSSYQIGDTILLDGIECHVCGIYESNYYSGLIGNLSEFNDDMNFSQVTFIYYGEDIISNYKEIENFIKEVDRQEFKNDLFNEYLQNKVKNNAFLMFFIAVAVIFFILTFFFYINSISMAFDEVRKYICMLKIVGMNKINLFLILFLYSFIIALIGSIISFIFLLVFSYAIDVKYIFDTLVISNFFTSVNDFEFEYIFPWYIIFIIIMFYFISVSLISFIYAYKYYENSLIKE